MQLEGSSVQPSSSAHGRNAVDESVGKENAQSKKVISSVTPLKHNSKQRAYASQDPETIDTIYKIVWSDRPDVSLEGKLYIRYNVPPEINSTGWFCIVAFCWLDVHAEFECIYHPSIKLFDDFKAIKGSLRGGSGGIQGVQISMWNFADRGPDLNPKHAVKDDNGNRLMLAVVIMNDESILRLRGKMVREGEDEKEVCLSRDERRRLGLCS